MTLVEIGELHPPSLDKNVTSSTSDPKKKQRRRAARPRHSRDDPGNTMFVGTMSAAAMEEPPRVWSPFASSSSSTLLQGYCGLQRTLVHQTPQHLATLQVPLAAAPSLSSSSSSSSPTINASFAMAPPLFYQEEYVIQALSSGGGKIAFWNLSHKRIVGQPPGESRKLNGTFRRTLHPDFVLDTGAHAPLVELALFHEPDAATAAEAISDPSNPIDDKPQRQQSRQHQNPSILALSTLGEVFCISIENSEQQQHQSSSSSSSNNMETKANSSSSANPPSSLCTAKVPFSWNTGRAGATCLTTAPPSHANTTEPTAKGLVSQRQVLIGYQSGHLEAWDISVNGMENQQRNDADKDKDSEISAAAAFTCDMHAEKLWTGVFDHHFPIHSLLHVPTTARLGHNLRGPTAADFPSSTTTTTNSGHCDDDEKGQAHKKELYLALTLHPPTRLSTPSYLEIINLTAVQQEAMRKAKRADKNVSLVSLENHWVLPLPGKEIRDPAAVQRDCGDAAAAAVAAASGDLRGRGSKRASTASKAANMPGTAHWIPSNSTNRLCSMGGCNFVVALADGTIGLFSATKAQAMHAQLCNNDNTNDDSNNNFNGSNSNGHSRLDWGISTPMDQLLLQYPCIGLGNVELQSTPHAVCALRGGTVYLIPLVDTADNNNRDTSPPPPPLTVITYPDDLDADTAMQHLQAFAAGMIVSHKDSSNTSPVPPNARLPLLLFSWPGGVIDVYSCHLLHSDAQVDRLGLGELLANGSVKSLESLLSRLGDEHGSGNRADLAQALGPCGCASMARREIEALNGNVLTLKDLSSEKLKTFRSILLRFAGRDRDGATLE